MHCVLTGCDPFGDAVANVSQLAVESESCNLEDIELHKAILPTCCDLAWESLQKTVSQVPQDDPFAIVISGMAASRSKISIERFALNVRAYPIADNRGHKWDEQLISDNAPDALKTSVDINKLRQTLERLGLLTETSYHAGTFICNETYFKALQKWSAQPHCKGILFIHLPSIDNYAAAKTKAMPTVTADPIQDYALALKETIRFMCG